MADIPRFYAQVGQVSVPRMKDFGYEQNVSIYKTLKAAGERIDNTFFEMVAEGKLGEPGRNENSEYIAKEKEFRQADANKSVSPEELQKMKTDLENTPRTKFSWWGR